MQYLFRQRVKNKMPCIGTIVGIPSPETAEVLSLIGFDWMDVKSVDPKGVRVHRAPHLLCCRALEAQKYVCAPDVVHLRRPVNAYNEVV
jgi:2-keto-3-deoxy-L-rhamnonate aldolase RhmA